MPSRPPPSPPRRAVRGAVLAGGASTRMGEPKADVPLGGRPMICRPVEAVRAAGLEPVVIAKAASRLPDLGCRVIRDGDARGHPAAGIVAALRDGGGAPVVVVACDMPFVEPGLIDLLAGIDAAAAAPAVGGRIEPLLARYSEPAIPVLETAIARGSGLGDAIRALEPRIVDSSEVARFGDPERMLANVNDRAGLAAAERLLETGASR